MKLSLAAAALAVVAIPLAIQGADGQTTQKEPKEKRYCEVTQQIGTRLGGIRRCRTKTEREEARQESRTVVDRIQNQKAFSESMMGAGSCSRCR